MQLRRQQSGVNNIESKETGTDESQRGVCSYNQSETNKLNSLPSSDLKKHKLNTLPSLNVNSSSRSANFETHKINHPPNPNIPEIDETIIKNQKKMMQMMLILKLCVTGFSEFQKVQSSR